MKCRSSADSRIGPSGGAGWSQRPPGADQVGFGVFLEETALNNIVADTNKIEGEPIVFVYGLDNANTPITGYVLTAEVNPTNWGKIAVFNTANVEISGNEVAGFVGASGCSLPETVGCAGEVGVGIRVQGCSSCSVNENKVRDIRGGTGGSSVSFGGPGG